MQDINIIRVEAKLEEMFRGKIDLSDLEGKKNDSEIKKAFLSRSLAAVAVMMQTGVEMETAAKSITDGYHDIGIDAIFCNEKQKQLVLVQSKWRSEGIGGISQEEVLAFVEGIKRVMSLQFEGVNSKINQKIPEITMAIRNMDYTVCAIYCHTGSQAISEYVRKPVEDLISITNEDTSEILKFSENKFGDIFSYLSSGQVNDNICIDDVILNNWGSMDGPLKAYYGTISAAAMGDWYSKFGNRLFAQNIRFYKGDTDVNEGMKKVLREEPEFFFYFNNGIKVLCKKVIRKSAYSTNNKTGLFLLEGVSLVNGAQTTGTIGEFYQSDREQTDKASVFVQIIELGENGDSKSLQITKLSNTQNKIENKDFAALDPEQERIRNELMFSDILYLYKTGAIIEDPEKQISIDEAIVAQACVQKDVSYSVTAKKNVGALTEDIKKAPYKVLFNSGTNAFTLINSVFTMRIVDKYLQNKEIDYEGRNKLALVHGNRLILHLVLNKISEEEDFNNQKLDKAFLIDKVDGIWTNILTAVIDAMNQVYPDAYPANIFKNVGRCRELINVINKKIE